MAVRASIFGHFWAIKWWSEEEAIHRISSSFRVMNLFNWISIEVANSEFNGNDEGPSSPWGRIRFCGTSRNPTKVALTGVPCIYGDKNPALTPTLHRIIGSRYPKWIHVLFIMSYLLHFPRFFLFPTKGSTGWATMGPILRKLLMSLAIAEASALGISVQHTQSQSTVTPRSAILYHNNGNWTVSASTYQCHQCPSKTKIDSYRPMPKILALYYFSILSRKQRLSQYALRMARAW